ncbi:hypothetical protein NA56DRAFT_699181 [Hyaloscypha hepaticicola]|uniref:Uncharacterized protein n=1 Tax=Hyaloscypha hepaticicola TaxID=2082293 RepID=A0A2J6QG60_9HELO|nr:hypothetical protein NA56DRAFT_699181 [Hyaloscypha hepaticicola]
MSLPKQASTAVTKQDVLANSKAQYPDSEKQRGEMEVEYRVRSQNTNDENDEDISKGTSAKAKLNQAAIKANPEVELFSEFPHIYKGAVSEQKDSCMTPALFKRNPPKGQP